MHGEVLDDMVDRLNASDIPLMLNVIGLQKRGGFHPSQDLVHFPQGRVQSLTQLGAWNLPLLGELRWAVPRVLDASERNHDPLPNVAIQVQQEIPDTIAALMRAPPDLIVREHSQALASARPKFIQQLAPREIEKHAREV
jgi:hypothetical protein